MASTRQIVFAGENFPLFCVSDKLWLPGFHSGMVAGTGLFVPQAIDREAELSKPSLRFPNRKCSSKRSASEQHLSMFLLPCTTVRGSGDGKDFYGL